MVAAEEPEFYTGIGKACQFAQHADIPARHHIAVLRPEIKDISQQKDSPGIGRQGAQELQEPFFTIPGGIPGFAEMHVGNKEVSPEQFVHRLCQQTVNQAEKSRSRTVEGKPFELRLLDQRNHYLAGKKA